MKEHEFKQLLRFLETDYSLSLTRFEYCAESFGNIIAEYTNGETTVRVVIDRSMPEIEISHRGSEPLAMDKLLKIVGASPPIRFSYRDGYDYFGHFTGTDLQAQAVALQNHLALIQQHFLTKK